MLSFTYSLNLSLRGEGHLLLTLQAVSLGWGDLAFVASLPDVQKETEGAQHECACARHWLPSEAV